VFSIICILVISIDSVKDNIQFWYFLLLAINLVLFILVCVRPSLFGKHNFWLSIGLFPFIVFASYIFWSYILNSIPLDIFGSTKHSTSLFFSLAVAGPIAAVAFFLATSTSVSLIFGKFSLLIPVATMWAMMFAHEAWFAINDFTDKMILFENLCLGLIVTILFYHLNNFVQRKIT